MREVQVPEHGYAVSVTLPGPASRTMVVEGRTARLIAWLLQHRGRVERTGVGSLVFNLGLGSFTPEIHEHFPRQPAIPESPEVTGL